MRQQSVTWGGLFVVTITNVETGKARHLEHKNLITDQGLMWLRGQVLKTPAYGSSLGELALGLDSTPPEPTDVELRVELDPSSPDYTYSRKRLTLAAGAEPGEIVAVAFWDTHEVNNVVIYEIGAFTVVGSESPPEAHSLLYARTVIPEGFSKTSSETITITRHEFLRRGIS